MPEGHIIHRLANEFDARFRDEIVHVSSPQGRFSDSAALVDRHTFAGAEAYGKHLFLRFDAAIAEPIIHIHLGLIGKLKFAPLAAPKGEIRVRINNAELAADLSGPQICHLISPDEQQTRVAQLGADPLRDDADPDKAWKIIHGSHRSVAALLMDQKIVAGAGNIYRAEVLFRARVNPLIPGTALKRHSWNALWQDLVTLMPDGVRTGRIDTVRYEHSPEVTGRPPRVDPHGGEVYVYRRAGLACLVCGSRIRTTMVENRTVYWCGRCQRRH